MQKILDVIEGCRVGTGVMSLHHMHVNPDSWLSGSFDDNDQPVDMQGFDCKDFKVRDKSVYQTDEGRKAYTVVYEYIEYWRLIHMNLKNFK